MLNRLERRVHARAQVRNQLLFLSPKIEIHRKITPANENIKVAMVNRSPFLLFIASPPQPSGHNSFYLLILLYIVILSNSFIPQKSPFVMEGTSLYNGKSFFLKRTNPAT